MARAQAWKNRIIKAQNNLCILCGHPVEPSQRSWDHFVPQVYSSEHNKTHRLGMVFMSHQKCNNARGHEMPTPELVQRAARIILASGTEDQYIAQETIKRALGEHLAYVGILREFIEEMKRGAA